VWLTPVILVTWESEIEAGGRPGQIVHKTLSQKYPTQNRAGRVAQVVEHLPSKPGSNPSTAPKKEKKLYYKNYTV
jgi:hypothetical protein